MRGYPYPDGQFLLALIPESNSFLAPDAIMQVHRL
jgi:hypothetical protein